LEDVRAKSDLYHEAARIIAIWGSGFHNAWDELRPDQQDTLCGAGTQIRFSMKAHHIARSDLNHVDRAIYDITAPAGRCP
jgi:hypothetical protein